MKLLLKLLKENKKVLCLLVSLLFIGLLNSVCGSIVSILIARYTPLTTEKLDSLIIWITIVLLISLAVQYILRKETTGLSYIYSEEIKVKYYNKLASLPIHALDSISTGEINSYILQISDGIQGLIMSLIWNITSVVISLIILFVALFHQSLYSGLTCLVVGTVYVLVSIILSKKQQPWIKELNQARAKSLGIYTDLITKMGTIKRLNIYNFANKKLNYALTEIKNSSKTYSSNMALKWLILDIMLDLIFVIALVATSIQANKGYQTALAFALFYIFSFMTLKASLQGFSATIESVVKLRTNICKLDSLLDFPLEDNCGILDEAWERIEIYDWKFEYDDLDLIISIPKFTIKKGERICIMGGSGNGKSTFLRMLNGELNPQKGFLLTYTKDECVYNSRPRCAIVTQGVKLFNASIRENLCLGQDIPDEKLWQILDDMNLSNWVRSLSKGLDHVLGEEGNNASEGQKQRLCFARSILLGPEILLLDEFTGQLDALNEKNLLNTVKNLKDKTAIIVTHNPKVASICDSLYVFENGTMTKVK